jgi:putative hemolysin
VISGFFSSAETAFTAINRIRLRQWFDKEKPNQSSKIEALLNHPSKLITAILIGNNFSNVACAALGTTILLDIFHQLNISNQAIIMPAITIIITTILLIFGEITPKTIALKQPERLAIFSSKFLQPLLTLLYPVIYIFELLNQYISSLLNIKASPSSLNIEELKLMIDISRDDGVIEDEKNKMISNIFEFSDTIVREIMTPRTDTICIADNDTIQNAIHLIINEGHSRIPVYEEKMDNIIGIIYAKDLLSVSKSETTQSLRKFMRKAKFVPEYTPVESLLQQMKRSKLHMAIVVDEHGGLSGIVTLEDIVEEILGEIQDEFDQDEKEECIKLSKNMYDVDAKINIKELEDILDVKFPEDENYDTLGGLILHIKESFPTKGETILFNGLQIEVTNIKKRRILRLKIVKLDIEPTNA